MSAADAPTPRVIKTSVEAITALVTATDRIANVFEGMDRDDRDSTKVSQILDIWDSWYSQEIDSPVTALKRIGNVLYGRKGEDGDSE